MQTRELWNRSKWKVVAGAAAVTALGIGGLALAQDGDDGQEADNGIGLQDLVSVDTFESPDVVVVGGGEVSDLDSPLDDDPTDVAGAEDSPDDGVAGAEDSPDDGAAGAEDSPEDSPAEAAETDSPASPDSPDSPDD
jgi:hypothetical protein